jgi:lipopolysaccharide assembly protein B
MEFEIWWLLALPIFFAMGWLAARIDIKQLLSESRSLPASYFKGLNFLLNEQPDKAIDAFIEVSKLDPNTVELQPVPPPRRSGSGHPHASQPHRT